MMLLRLVKYTHWTEVSWGSSSSVCSRHGREGLKMQVIALNSKLNNIVQHTLFLLIPKKCGFKIKLVITDCHISLCADVNIDTVII